LDSVLQKPNPPKFDIRSGR